MFSVESFVFGGVFAIDAWGESSAMRKNSLVFSAQGLTFDIQPAAGPSRTVPKATGDGPSRTPFPARKMCSKIHNPALPGLGVGTWTSKVALPRRVLPAWLARLALPGRTFPTWISMLIRSALGVKDWMSKSSLPSLGLPAWTSRLPLPGREFAARKFIANIPSPNPGTPDAKQPSDRITINKINH